MSSENLTGADNQQETATPRLKLDPQWVVGFVDGEACFSVSIHAHPGVKSFGWQINPVFHVYQHQDVRFVLDALVPFFGCGRVRAKGGTSSVLTYAVDRLLDLEERIIPFFESQSPIVKYRDFQRFGDIVELLTAKVHLSHEGFERAVRLAYSMNANGK